MDKKNKDIIINHFDKIVESDEWKKIAPYGSSTVNYYLRCPYIHIDKIIDALSEKNLSILDYCCGTGIYSINPAKKGHYVHGIDFSLKSIEIAREKAKFYRVEKNTLFTEMDAEDLKYDDNSFDIILSYGSLSYLNLDRSYKELNRVLKPGGKLIVVDSLGHNPIFRLNRSKNISGWASKITNLIGTLKIEDIKYGNNFFELNDILFFDFFTVLASFLVKSKKNKTIRYVAYNMDKLLLKIPFINLYAFKYVAIYDSIKKN